MHLTCTVWLGGDTCGHTRFCEFNADYNEKEGRFHCALGDWQNHHPLCSYAESNRLPAAGCDIANHEGMAAREFLEFLVALKSDPELQSTPYRWR